MSGVTLADSRLYGHLWGTDETRALFDDRGRTGRWLEILGALALAQAELGIVPAAAAEAIAEAADVDRIDLAEVGEETRRSGHSTLGLIRVVQRALPDDARPWVSFGATVQDVTDTWTGIVAREMLAILRRDLGAAERHALALARRHRDDVMLGRTHGQPGLPITFGFKAAGWAAELRRTLERVEQARGRLAVGQLAGAVGTLSSFGDAGPRLREAFLRRLGLGVPEISWLTARDRVAELVTLLAFATGALARIGNEVYNLQRQELGELREPVPDAVVSSITMPQKRNPERSEHLVTLDRAVRSALMSAFETLAGEHERDGATWKSEWALLPQACTAAGAALALGEQMLAGLEVDVERMRANVAAQRGYVLAEPVMVALSDHVGKTRAHELVQAAARRGLAADVPLLDALLDEPEVVDHLGERRLRELLADDRAPGVPGALVDDVLAAAEPLPLPPRPELP